MDIRFKQEDKDAEVKILQQIPEGWQHYAATHTWLREDFYIVQMQNKGHRNPSFRGLESSRCMNLPSVPSSTDIQIDRYKQWGQKAISYKYSLKSLYASVYKVNIATFRKSVIDNPNLMSFAFVRPLPATCKKFYFSFIPLINGSFPRMPISWPKTKVSLPSGFWRLPFLCQICVNIFTPIKWLSLPCVDNGKSSMCPQIAGSLTVKQATLFRGISLVK